MAALDRLITIMQQQKVYEIYLPFLLTFSIFYALLRKSKIFYSAAGTAQDKIGNNITIVVSVVAALYVTIFTPVGITISHYFAMFFTQASVAMIALLVLIMISSMLMSMPFFEGEKRVQEVLKNWVGIVLGLGVLLVLIMFASSGGLNLFTRFGLRLNIDPADFGLILLVLGTVAIIFLATRGEEETEETLKKKLEEIEKKKASH